MTDQQRNDTQDEQAKEVIDQVLRSFKRNTPLFILVQYNHEADKFNFLKRLQAVATQNQLGNRSYDPLNNPEHGASKLYPLFETDASQKVLSLVVSMPREQKTDELAADFLSYINLHRDRIAHHRLHFILFVRDSDMARFMLGASDLWSFRHNTYWLDRALAKQPDVLWKNMEQLREELKLAPQDKQQIDEHITKTRQLIEQTIDKEDKAQLLLDLTQWFIRHYAPTLAAEAAIEGIELLNGEVCDLLRSLEHGLAYALSDSGHIADALTHYKASLAIIEQLEDKKGQGATLNNIAMIYKAKGDVDTALVYLRRSLVLSERIADKQGQGATLNNISQIYHNKGEYDTALNYLQRSLVIYEETEDKKGEGIVLNNISQIYQAKEDYDTALDYLQRSLVICEKVEDKQGQGATFNNISSIYNVKGEYDKALVYMQRSLVISETIGNKAGESLACWNLGFEYERRGDLTQAIEYISRTLAIEIQTDRPDAQKTADYLAGLKQQLADLNK
jgi:tetratricopeptide (TPR) repeat protein